MNDSEVFYKTTYQQIFPGEECHAWQGSCCMLSLPLFFAHVASLGFLVQMFLSHTVYSGHCLPAVHRESFCHGSHLPRDVLYHLLMAVSFLSPFVVVMRLVGCWLSLANSKSTRVFSPPWMRSEGAVISLANLIFMTHVCIVIAQGVIVKEHFSELVNTEVTSVSRRFVALLSP